MHKGYPDATGVDYVYDLVGKIKQVTDPTGTYGFAYDNMGRLIGTTTQYSFLPGITYSNAYGYDATSNRTQFTAPDGSTNTYAYDTLNRLSTLTNSLTGQFGFSYDSLSRKTGLTRPNSVNTSYSYDSVSRLLNVLHNTGTVTLDGVGYTYDNAANRTAKTNYLNNITENYTYDPLYQLTQVTQGTTTTESYSYDAVGNRLSSLGMSPYAYNSSNELTSTPAATFTYDGNGNTLTKTDSSGTTTYSWDFENRLTAVALPGTGGTVAFKYDPLGRRIQKSAATGTTNYLYEGSNSIAEVDTLGALLASYTQSMGIDEPLAQMRSGTAGYYQQDGLGSVTSVTDSFSGLANTYKYDSYGNTTASTGSLKNPFQYGGRDYDSETGLQYYRARYLDSSTGRFISEDPIQFMSGRGGFYSYVLNNPLLWTDPSGMKPGDKYPNCQNAAFDALKDIFRRSMSEGLEYAGRLYLNRDGTCSYTTPRQGAKNSSSPGGCPWFTKEAGSYHTHPNAPGYAVEEYSDQDLLKDSVEGEPGYLATPSGKVWRHDPWSDPVQVGTIGGPPQQPKNSKPSPKVR